MWDMLNDLGRDLIKNKWQNELTVELINGRKIKLKGSDKPDTLRGSAVGFVVLDEFASMKPEVWDLIIRPALADTRGRALFIGTPDGLNHFYGIWKQGSDDSFREWASFMFNTLDNPIIDEEELVEAAGTMTQEAFAQEFEASFQAAGGGDLRPSDIIYMPNSPEPGSIVMTIDPAGYGDTRGLTKSKLAKADETAIAIAEVSPAGWFYHEVIHGRWDIRETSLRIVRAAQQYRPTRVGVESGALSNAVMPYIVDQQKRLNTHFKVWPLKHGGKKKQDRIMWSLQGRLENGRIFFKQGMDNRPLEWHKYIIQQMNDFPNPMAHDDGIDSMAYTDQLASTVYHAETIVEDTEDWDDTYWEYE
jgi:predicted phage terminase large subunit-like protein